MVLKLDVSLRPVDEHDIAIVAAMNRRLVEDEGSRNPFSEAEYLQRISDWLNGDEWELVLFTNSVDVALGYAVYKLKKDDYFRKREIVLVRQFFIDRPFRGRGWGRMAFTLLVDNRFKHREVFLDVLTTNPGGRRFWEKMGFTEYFVSMRKG